MNNNSKELNEKVKLLEEGYQRKVNKNYAGLIVFLCLGFILLIAGIIIITIFGSKPGTSTLLTVMIPVGIFLLFTGVSLVGVFLPLTIVGLSSKSKAKSLIAKGTLHEFCYTKAYKMINGIELAKPEKAEKKVEVKTTVAEKKNVVSKTVTKTVSNKVTIKNSGGGFYKNITSYILQSLFSAKSEIKTTVPSGLQVFFTRHKTVYEDGNSTYEVIEKSVIFGIFSRKPTLISENGKELFSIYRKGFFAKLFTRHDTLYKRGDKVIYKITEPSLIASIFCNTTTTFIDVEKNLEKQILNPRTIFGFFVKRTSIIKN